MKKIIFILAVLSAGCASVHQSNNDRAPIYYAVSELKPVDKSQVKGVLLFSEAFGHVEIEGVVTGLDKNSKHGFHIHEFGDCTSLDAASAGGHYNPSGHKHGNVTDKERHPGDLGNLITDANGKAIVKIKIQNISISGEHNPILGRGLIVHKGMDDFVSQPTGGAGARIACGVIGAADRPKN